MMGPTAEHGSASSPEAALDLLAICSRKPSSHQLLDQWEVRRAGLLDVELQQLGHGVEDLPDAEFTVACPHQRSLHGVDLTGAAQPPLLAQHDRLRVLGAGRPEGLLLEVDARLEPRCRGRPDADRLPQARMAGAIGCSTS